MNCDKGHDPREMDSVLICCACMEDTANEIATLKAEVVRLNKLSYPVDALIFEDLQVKCLLLQGEVARLTLVGEKMKLGLQEIVSHYWVSTSTDNGKWINEFIEIAEKALEGA